MSEVPLYTLNPKLQMLRKQVEANELFTKEKIEKVEAEFASSPQAAMQTPP